MKPVIAEWRVLSSKVVALVEVSSGKVMATIIPHCGGLNHEARLLNSDMTVDVIAHSGVYVVEDAIYPDSTFVSDSYANPDDVMLGNNQTEQHEAEDVERHKVYVINALADRGYEVSIQDVLVEV